MQHTRSVGFVGFGSFGRFAASILPQSDDLEIRAYDRDPKPMMNVKLESLEAVIDSDIVVLTIPLEAYPEVLPLIAKRVKPETLLIDICSVKTKPEALLTKHLPDHKNVLLTHPLFGPQSASDSTTGHKLIITKSEGELATVVLDYAENQLGLTIHQMTAEEHDRLMAQVHVLTFFVARGLSSLDLAASPFVTPSYRMITDLVAFDRSHSDELFRTIQQGNPYADEMREHVVKVFSDLEASLKKESE